MYIYIYKYMQTLGKLGLTLGTVHKCTIIAFHSQQTIKNPSFRVTFVSVFISFMSATVFLGIYAQQLQ